MASEPGTPPPWPEDGLLAHYKNVKDAEPPYEEVTSDTRLAALDTSDYSDRTITDINSFTDIAACAVPCQVHLEDGTFFPSLSHRRQHGYGLYITFNHLMFSPKLRLEYHFKDLSSSSSSSSSGTFHTAALEFPFSREDSRRLEDFNVVHVGQITFTSHGATVSGLDSAAQYEDRLTQDQQDAILFLTNLSTRTSARLKIISLITLSGNAARVQREIHMRLPGGAGPLLKSIGEVEYAAFSERERIYTARGSLKTPASLMKAEFPMKPLAPQETFSSMKQAAVHLTYAATTAHLEEELSLKMWASVPHEATLFRVTHYEQPILAVKFDRSFGRLASADKRKTYKLPREIQVAVRETPWLDTKYSRSTDDGKTLSCRQCEFSGIRGYDAFFEVLNESNSSVLHDPSFRRFDQDNRNAPRKKLWFKPHLPSFSITCVLETSGHLQSEGDQWHLILLNGDKRSLDMVDITSSVGDRGDPRITEADDWMFGWRDWNPEQRAVLATIHQTKGGLVIVKGVAGTGKTLLQAVLAIYFARLGYKVLVTPPSNQNATHSAMVIATAILQDRAEKLVRQSSPIVKDGCTTPISKFPTVCRVYANSLGHAAEHTTRGQAQFAQPFHDQRATSTLKSLLFTLSGHTVADSAKRDYDIEHKVIDETDKGQFKYFAKRQHLGLSQSRICGENVDVWPLMREFLRQARQPDFDFGMMSSEEKFLYNAVYKACKSQVLAATDVIMTTTGNARCAEVLNCWLDPSDQFGIRSKGVICLLDEAFKDLELATWNAICAGGKRVKGVFMFGDDMQLKPVNTTSNDELAFGHFNQQIDVSLPGRLANQGFPVITLLEQSRMASLPGSYLPGKTYMLIVIVQHGVLSGFPNREFYGGALRDHTRVNDTCALPPGLETKLHGIIADSLPTQQERERFLATATEAQARHHYIQVDGERRTPHPDSTSVFVEEHVDVFFDHIFPVLQEHFGRETYKNVMVICAYSAALGLYKDKIENLRNTQVLPASLQQAQASNTAPAPATAARPNATQGAVAAPTRVRHPEGLYPRVLTVDGSQGQESFCVIFDGSFQHSNAIGFLKESGRCNVALTRAQAMLWIIGGQLSMSRDTRHNRALAKSHLRKMQKEMYMLGRWHKIVPKRLMMMPPQQLAIRSA